MGGGTPGRPDRDGAAPHPTLRSSVLGAHAATGRYEERRDQPALSSAIESWAGLLRHPAFPRMPDELRIGWTPIPYAVEVIEAIRGMQAEP